MFSDVLLERGEVENWDLLFDHLSFPEILFLESEVIKNISFKGEQPSLMMQQSILAEEIKKEVSCFC